jgi:hypothetical protein
MAVCAPEALKTIRVATSRFSLAIVLIAKLAGFAPIT